MNPSRFKISAIATFIFDEGIATVEWRTMHALRMRVSISAIGSLTLTTLLLEDQLQLWAGIARGRSNSNKGCHQLDLVTPGINPLSAFSRKQIRHIPNLRI